MSSPDIFALGCYKHNGSPLPYNDHVPLLINTIAQLEIQSKLPIDFANGPVTQSESSSDSGLITGSNDMYSTSESSNETDEFLTSATVTDRSYGETSEESDNASSNVLSEQHSHRLILHAERRLIGNVICK